MSVSISNLFNFSKTLPEPFNTLASKKVKVSSKYGSGTESTLCATVIKAIHAVCNCMMGTGEGAVGSIDHRTVAEYKSAAGTDIYHLVVFDSSSGNIMASVYDKNTETIENYQCHSSARDGAAVMMALVPLLLKDDEFDENFQTYFDQRVAGYPDMKKATEAMAILCDNAYRRIKDDSCPEHIKVTLDKSGNVLRVSQSHLLAGAYTPTSVLAGEFTIFAQTGKVTVSASRSAIDHKDFVSQYKLTGSRILTALEEALVPKLEEWYIIPEEVVDICKHALSTTGKPMQMKNPVAHAEKIRRGPPKGKDAFTADEVRKLMKELPEDKIGWSIRLMLATGMRTQELLALEPRHIAKDGSSINIAQAIVMEKGSPTIGPTKTHNSLRTIPVPETVRYCARNLRDTDGTFIWESPRVEGKPINPSYFRDHFREYLKAIEEVRVLTPHCCRHTYVTHMLALGVDPKTVQALVGHAEIDMTMYYAHAQESSKQEAISRYDEAFSAPGGGLYGNVIKLVKSG